MYAPAVVAVEVASSATVFRSLSFDSLASVLG
jgi:hypothetical protein